MIGSPLTTMDLEIGLATYERDEGLEPLALGNRIQSKPSGRTFPKIT